LFVSWKAPLTLDKTLESIYAQTAAVPYEVVLVNNGFGRERADSLRARYASLSIIDEPKPGLVFARLAAFRAAQGEFLVLLDDDNFLGDNFFAPLAELLANNPRLGGVCAAIIPKWGATPPAWLPDFGRRCLGYNTPEIPDPSAIEVKVWRDPDTLKIRIPPGGGMIIRRAVAMEYLDRFARDPRRSGLGRAAGALGACEDVDIYTLLVALKLDAAYSNQLQIFHQIPPNRWDFKYLVKLNAKPLRDFAVLVRIWKSENNPYARNDYFWGNVRWAPKLVYQYLRGGIALPRLTLELVRIANFLLASLRIL